jgi:nicotinate phosphoribosyltransferase
MGTVPHALIAAYHGDTVLATKKFAEYIDRSVHVISLVDFDNDCVQTSLEVARALGKRLWGVRLDTSGTMVDRSLWNEMGTFVPTGVVPELVRNVRSALDRERFEHVKIVVSGGFNADKIAAFEARDVPVDAYAVGSAFFEGTGKFDFTADIVAVERDGAWVETHKAGRPPHPNRRLVHVE